MEATNEEPTPNTDNENSQESEERKERVNKLANYLRVIMALKHAKTDPAPVEIVNGLFLGSVGAAMNKTDLTDLGVTHILTVADKIQPFHPDRFTYKVIPILDSAESNLKDILPEALEYIDAALSSGGKVLVHCFAGKSRSSSVIIAWLVARRSMSLGAALHFVREKRPAVMPNTGFMHQLKEFEQGVLNP